MRALAVTAAERLPSFPGVPTMAEAGIPSFDYASWYGLLAPAGTPDARIAAINGHLRNAVHQSDVAVRMAGMGANVIVSSAQTFGLHLQTELARWARAVEAGKLR
jgi:tripartite-type tricarboxylate transporter receptor subunit TctC